MALTFSSTQAIKFLESDEASFNSSEICSCGPEGAEKWSYVVTDGDTIDFQILSNCELSDEIVENGSFETGTGTDFTGSDWTRSVAATETTNVTRISNNAAQCGSRLAFWIVTSETPTAASITQTYASGFTTGQVYKFTIKAKLTESIYPTNSNADVLKLTIGGKIYYITPTTSWAEYTLYVAFATAPSNDDIKIEVNTASAANINELYVDCVSMQEFEGCCIKELVNNGSFDNGQVSDGDIVATADNWTLDDATVLDTGGRDGGRGVRIDLLNGSVTQADVLLENTTHIVTFWAKADTLPCAVSVYAGATLIDSVLLTTSWAEYSLQFFNLTEDDIIFTQEENGNDIYLDDISIVSIPLIGIFINDLNSETSIPIDASNIAAYPSHINVSIPVDSYDMPACFNICVETCLENLVSNGNFEQGSGNTFTNWVQTLNGGTIVEATRTNLLTYSQEFDNAAWGKINATVTANAVTAPDGTLTSDKLVENAGSGQKYVLQQYITALNETFTFSTYIQADGRNFVRYGMTDGISDSYVDVNLTTGSTSNLTALGSWSSPSIEIIEINGFFRVCFTCTKGAGTSVFPIIYLCNTIGNTSYTGDGTSGIYLWGAQLEANIDYASDYIPTASSPVTVNDGINDSRAVRLNTVGGNTSINQTVAGITVGQTYKISFWTKRYIGTGTVNVNGTNFTVDTEDWAYNEFNYTAITTTIAWNLSTAARSVGIDDIIIVALPTASRCSEDFSYTDTPDECISELIWYDNNDEAMDIIYSTGFRNKMRVKAQLQSPQYIKDEFTASFNNDQISINSFSMRKTNELAIDNLPEFVVDRIALMAGVSNIQYGTTLLRPAQETEISTTYDRNSRTMGMTIVVSPSSEYLGSRQYNCS